MEFFRKSRDGHLYRSIAKVGVLHKDRQAHWDAAYELRNVETEKNERMEKLHRDSDIPGFIFNSIRAAYGDRRDIKILELGCGVGTYSMMLLEDGYDVVMSDFSTSLVEGYLKPRLKAASFSEDRAFVSDARDLSSLGTKYDVIILVGIVYEFSNSGVPGEVYSQVHAHLANGGGGIFIHVLNSYCNTSSRRFDAWPVRAIHNIKSMFTGIPSLVLTRLRRSALLRKAFNKDPAGAGTIQIKFAHYLFKPEFILSTLEKTGFSSIETADLDFYDQEKTSEPFGAQRIGFAARARAR